jgi:hypothetical protein
MPPCTMMVCKFSDATCSSTSSEEGEATYSVSRISYIHSKRLNSMAPPGAFTVPVTSCDKRMKVGSP